MCDRIESGNQNIAKTSTKYRKVPLSCILYEMFGNDIEIAIGSDETICKMCALLIDELDWLRFNLSNIETIVAHKLHRKYKYSTVEMRRIRLDKQTAELFASSTGRRFQCKTCSFSTNFVDCLLPHNLVHQHEHDDAYQSTDEYSCENCQLILPSEASLKQHQLLFHEIEDIVDPPLQEMASNSDGEAESYNDDLLGYTVCALH